MSVQAVSPNASRPSLFPNFVQLRHEWFGNTRRDLLAAITVALALIPEAIAFSIVVGVDPRVGLYASFLIAVTTAIFGGRPGMISAATGAMALLAVNLVAQHGVEYLYAATILTGVLQLVFRLFRLSRYMKFVPHTVMSGFVNALAILIFAAQLSQFEDATWHMYALVAAGLGIIYGLPRLTRAVPSALAAIAALTALVWATGTSVRTVGDMGSLPSELPFFHLPQVPLTLETVRIIFPYAVALAMVGLVESLLTAAIVDELTDSASDKHREATGQGLANVVAGLFGGMAGCAMIGQSVIAVKSGGRGRLCTFCSGVFLLVLVLCFGDLVAKIPMGALVAVMFMVAFGTVDRVSIKAIRTQPVSESLVMLSTMGTVVLTHDLALGVLVGVLLSAVLFARSVEKLVQVEFAASDDRQRYRVRGEIFFASTGSFVSAFDFRHELPLVEIDLTEAHVWDASAVAAIDRVVLKFKIRGKQVRLLGLNEASQSLLERLAIHDKPGAALGLPH